MCAIRVVLGARRQVVSAVATYERQRAVVFQSGKSKTVHGLMHSSIFSARSRVHIGAEGLIFHRAQARTRHLDVRVDVHLRLSKECMHSVESGERMCHRSSVRAAACKQCRAGEVAVCALSCWRKMRRRATNSPHTVHKYKVHLLPRLRTCL